MKRMILVVLASVMMLSLAACKKDTSEVSDDKGGAVTYTVTVKDQDGNGVSGCIVNFCNASSCSPVNTDENGVYSYQGEAYAYHIQVVKVPEGYTYDTSKEYTAQENGGNIDVAVTKE